MGWDPSFKVKHNLAVSSIDLLVEDLKRKLNCKVFKYMEEYDIELAEFLGINVDEYDKNIDIGSIDCDTIFVSDELFIARSVIAKYGDRAIDVLTDAPDGEGFIKSLDEARNGSISYHLEYGWATYRSKNWIYDIYGETLCGSADFPGRWFLFEFLLNPEYNDINVDQWAEFMVSRKKLYGFLKPMIKEMPVYYHSDQGDMEMLGYIDSMVDSFEYMRQNELVTYDLTDYILNRDSKEKCEDSYLSTVFADDFRDLMQQNDLI